MDQLSQPVDKAQEHGWGGEAGVLIIDQDLKQTGFCGYSSKATVNKYSRPINRQFINNVCIYSS